VVCSVSYLLSAVLLPLLLLFTVHSHVCLPARLPFPSPVFILYSVPHRQKQRASTYFPAKLTGVYQTAQNITNSHLSQLCHRIPAPIRRELQLLQSKKSGAGGGRKYWSESAEACGIYETETEGLRFKDNKTTTKEEEAAADATEAAKDEEEEQEEDQKPSAGLSSIQEKKD